MSILSAEAMKPKAQKKPRLSGINTINHLVPRTAHYIQQ